MTDITTHLATEPAETYCNWMSSFHSAATVAHRPLHRRLAAASIKVPRRDRRIRLRLLAASLMETVICGMLVRSFGAITPLSSCIQLLKITCHRNLSGRKSHQVTLCAALILMKDARLTVMAASSRDLPEIFFKCSPVQLQIR